MRASQGLAESNPIGGRNSLAVVIILHQQPGFGNLLDMRELPRNRANDLLQSVVL